MNITDSPNMVCKVNHAMEDLQHKILDFSKYCLLRYHLKMERVKEKRKNLGGEGNKGKRKKQKSNGNPGWQDRGNMRDVNCRIKVYIKVNCDSIILYKLLLWL